jgi:hypothetical protein
MCGFTVTQSNGSGLNSFSIESRVLQYSLGSLVGKESVSRTVVTP